MTQEIFGADWRDEVIALAAEGNDIDLAQGATESIIMRAVFGGAVASQRKDNSNFTFSVVDTPAATATDLTVSAAGVITAGSTAGTAVIEVTLTGYPNVAPAYVKVTVE